jgi:hypothetical protein
VCIFRRKVMVPKNTYLDSRGGEQPGRPVPQPDKNWPGPQAEGGALPVSRVTAGSLRLPPDVSSGNCGFHAGPRETAGANARARGTIPSTSTIGTANPIRRSPEPTTPVSTAPIRAPR